MKKHSFKRSNEKDINKIYNEDCLLTLSKMKDESVDLIVKSHLIIKTIGLNKSS